MPAKFAHIHREVSEDLQCVVSRSPSETHFVVDFLKESKKEKKKNITLCSRIRLAAVRRPLSVVVA